LTKTGSATTCTARARARRVSASSTSRTQRARPLHAAGTWISLGTFAPMGQSVIKGNVPVQRTRLPVVSFLVVVWKPTPGDTTPASALPLLALWNSRANVGLVTSRDPARRAAKWPKTVRERQCVERTLA